MFTYDINIGGASGKRRTLYHFCKLSISPKLFLNKKLKKLMSQDVLSSNLFMRVLTLMFRNIWGAWVAQSFRRPTLAQVMISWCQSSSPTSGSVLTAQSLEPALDSDSVILSLSVPPPFTPCPSQRKISKH